MPPTLMNAGGTARAPALICDPRALAVCGCPRSVRPVVRGGIRGVPEAGRREAARGCGGGARRGAARGAGRGWAAVTAQRPAGRQ